MRADHEIGFYITYRLVVGRLVLSTYSHDVLMRGNSPKNPVKAFFPENDNSGHPAAPGEIYDQNTIPKNRGEKTARYCRFERPKKTPFSKNTQIKKDFSLAWTPFPLQPENGIAFLTIRAFYGVF
jgi:hypothetical protein